MFKDFFKYYKSKEPPPDFGAVIDFKKPDYSKVRNILPDVNEDEGVAQGLKPIKEWKIYGIISKPGLIFIENPFTTLGQQYWITRCVRDYSSKPNKTNLDLHNLFTKHENWWDECSNAERARTLLPKLRWATLGYHHNWDTKEYSENAKDSMPEDMMKLTRCLAKVASFHDFKAESAIVNYYRMNSTLSGHTDHSEVDCEAPLFSVSFGQTAIFLIGGLLREDPADAIFIRSGDIVIMSKSSRLRYHGVPRILAADSTPWESESSKDITQMKEKFSDWDRIKSYICESRVNMNVRQVLRPGQTSLDNNSP
ncbi:nucleic acid dioxygenase ALKBH1 isoform X2 [Athalia rosae]|uniref:nucleic acid dioxygenase ALKBH1 isoform X2 n=1 Tax=Athalia rosae TaxID=37344 RepID=UPI00203348E1|nr:nucleic acid dioxygenase ALKBH1 isoform X2 [Athalia rosae]